MTISVPVFGPYGFGWKYQRTSKGAPPPSGAWTSNGYDDSVWPTGQGGYGDGGLGPPRVAHTLWATGPGGVEDLYLRLTIPTSWAAPSVSLNIDDTADIYIGGALWQTRPVWSGGVYIDLGPIPSGLRGGGDCAMAVKCTDSGSGASYFDIAIVDHPAPLRQRQRDDGLISTGRSGGPNRATSSQGSTRAGGHSTYL